MDKFIRILIADDHQIVIDGLKSILNNQEGIDVIAQAMNGEEAMQKLETMEVDLAILDINMPIMDGIEAIKLIKEKHPLIKVLILTMFNEPGFIKKMAEVGADGFILKNTGKTELMAAIELIMDGNSYYGQEVTKTLLDSFKIKPEDNPIELTGRETEILKLLADGLTTAEIAEKLFISSHTVESHRKNLHSKFHVKNTTGLIKYAFQKGLIDFSCNE